VGLNRIIVIFFCFLLGQDQSDISALNKRLKAVEAITIVHTAQIASINATLTANVAQTNVNTANIFLLNTSVISDEQRISLLETDLNATIDRLTADEVKLLGVMDNVTALQSDVATLQQDVITLIAEVTTLQYNVTVQAGQINALQIAVIQNAVSITNIISYMQGNLSIIDSRLDALNTTYTMTAEGTALVMSGPATPSPVTWQVRRFVETGGVDVEYLWVSDTNWNPTQIRTTTPPDSFEIGSWLPYPPVNATNTLIPDTGLWRPLTPYQKSKFIFPVVSLVPNPQVTAVRWNNYNQTLDFQSNLNIFDAVTIVAPLTFIIGFL